MINFVIIGSPRVGNHFIRALLSSTRKVQLTNRELIMNEDKSGVDINKIMKIKRNKPLGIVPFHPNHRNLSLMFPNISEMQGFYPKVIFLSRRDILEQAVSWKRAKTTNVYSIHDRSIQEKRKLNESEIDISEKDLLYHVLLSAFGDKAIESFCIEHQIVPYKIFYEDFLDELTRERHVAKILDFLSVPYKLPLMTGCKMEIQRRKSSAELYPGLIKKIKNRVSPEYLPFKL